MSERFTVGPWHVATNSNERRVIVEAADGQRIASAFFRGDVGGWAEIAEANAALIAAAPDLYEALSELVRVCSIEPMDRPIFERARAALLRAQASEQSGG